MEVVSALTTSTENPTMQARALTVAFPGHVALDRVDFRLFAGEIHAVLGENGAGKSTLIKALTGVLRPDEGELLLDGEPVRFASPADGLRHGIAAVYQEVDLIPSLSVAENVMLGREPRRFGTIDWKRTRQLADEALARLGLRLDVTTSLGSHSLAVQQLVAIARALAADARVLILDEPTSSLDNDEVTEFFRAVRSLTAQGVAVLFVSHFLEQVYELADRLTVLRDGHLIGEYLPSEILRIDVVSKMVGRKLTDLDALEHRMPSPGADATSATFLLARGVTRRGAVNAFDLEVAEGELIGVAGLLGSGRTSLARALSGADRIDGGRLAIRGRVRRLRTPRAAIRRGIVYSSENRRAGGIVADLTVRENIVLALQADRGWWRPISKRRQKDLAESYLESLDIRPADTERLAGTLSGGNQQKVLLARWLAMAPSLLVLDEPTRGVDIGAKVDVQRLVTELAANGMAVLFISAELEEVLRVSDRVLVMREHSLVADLPNDDLSLNDLLGLIAYGAADDVGRP